MVLKVDGSRAVLGLRFGLFCKKPYDHQLIMATILPVHIVCSHLLAVGL